MPASWATAPGEPPEQRVYTLTEWQELGYDRHSVFADPLFVDPEHDDYRVRDGSPALGIGFENFDMRSFGTTADYPDTFGGAR